MFVKNLQYFFTGGKTTTFPFTCNVTATICDNNLLMP